MGKIKGKFAEDHFRMKINYFSYFDILDIVFFSVLGGPVVEIQGDEMTRWVDLLFVTTKFILNLLCD